MKVVLLAPTPPPAGGIASWTVRMINANLKNNWEVSVVDEKTIGNRQVFGKEGKKDYFDEIKRCRLIWKNLKRELKDTEVKVVHSCIPSATLSMLREYVCAFITKKRKRKFIIHFRCTVPNTTRGPIGLFVLKRLCNKADMIISLNNQTTMFLEKMTKTPIRLIPNFIEAIELVKEHKTREKVGTILYVGGIIDAKGLDDMIAIAEQTPDITYRFVGKGDDSFEKEAQKRGLTNVVFVGPKDRDGIREEFRNADVFMFLSRFYGEGFSNALCEAMAAGLPCIVTDWAANADMIGSDGGFITKIRDVEGAIKAIEKIKPKDVREKMSKANIEKVSKCYIDRIVLDMYVDTYEEMVK